MSADMCRQQDEFSTKSVRDSSLLFNESNLLPRTPETATKIIYKYTLYTPLLQSHDADKMHTYSDIAHCGKLGHKSCCSYACRGQSLLKQHLA